MDPRPYHYQYRRPRLNNPTYQSFNLYESIYQIGRDSRYRDQLNTSRSPTNAILNRQYANQTESYRKINMNMPLSTSVIIQNNNNNFIPIKSNNSTVELQTQKRLSESLERPNSNGSKSKLGMQERQNPSILSSYGKNSMKTYDYLDRFNIYRKQQKPYNIVGNYPQQNTYQLKKYPKLTLEHKLIQQGRFNPQNR